MNISGVALDEFTIITSAVSAARYGGNIIVHQDGQNTGIRKERCTARLAARDSRGPGTRVSWSGRHGPWACWHAYRDVLIAVFDAHPDAVIRTGMAVYRGREGFLAAYPATAGKNIGSQMEPAYMPELCECDDTEADAVPREEPDFGIPATRAVTEYYRELVRIAPTSDAMLSYKAIEDEFAGTWVNPLHP